MNKRNIQVILNVILVVISIINLFIHWSILNFLMFVLACLLLGFLKEPVKEESPKEEVVLEEPEEEVLVEEEADDLNFPNSFNEKEFAKTIYLLYCDIQEDFMNFHYDSLMDKLGMEMYEQFSKQMRHLEESGKQSVRKNIELQKIEIKSFHQGKDSDISVVHLSVLEDKYMKKLEEPFRLTSARVRYESCYAVTVCLHHRKRSVRKCSNCSVKLQGNPSKCPECGHMLLENSENWILKDLQLVCSHSYSPNKKES